MDKTKNILMVGGLVATGIASTVAAGVGTYKAYPVLHQCILDKEKPTLIAKKVCKYYIPAFGITLGMGALAVAGEVLGEKRIAEIETKLYSAEGKFNKVKGWYKNQSEALNEVLTEKEKKKLITAIREKESSVVGANKTDIYRFYDPVCGMTFDSTEAEVLLAINEVNKAMVLEEGVGWYSEFYSHLGLDMPVGYNDYGWSYLTASACWVSPWIEIKFEDQHIPEIGDVRTIFFEGDGGGPGNYLLFEPVKDPEGEEWE